MTYAQFSFIYHGMNKVNEIQPIFDSFSQVILSKFTLNLLDFSQYLTRNWDFKKVNGTSQN